MTITLLTFNVSPSFVFQSTCREKKMFYTIRIHKIFVQLQSKASQKQLR